jgi:hypothetical protein
VPGFKFLKDPCNPCLALNDPANYSCPFKLDIKDTEEGVSPVWSYLWRTKGNITDPELKPLDVSSYEYTGSTTFPILNQLKNPSFMFFYLTLNLQFYYMNLGVSTGTGGLTTGVYLIPKQ